MSLVRFRFTNFRYVLAFARWNFGIGKNRSLPTTLIRSEHPFRGKINVTIAVFFSKFDLVLISHGIEQRGNSGYGNASLLGNQRSRKPYSTFCRERTVGKLFFNPASTILPRLTGAGWRAWRLGTPKASPPNARNVTLIPGSIAYVFMSPAREAGQPARLGNEVRFRPGYAEGVQGQGRI